jgi:hypothetical protein
MAAGASFNPAMMSKVVAVPPKKVTATIRPNNQLSKTQTQVYWPDPYRSLTQSAHVGHVAWDIEAPAGSPVFAPVSGTVVGVRPMDPWGWGNTIEILTPDGFHLYFAHLSGFEVQQGQQVIGGQEIGKSGNTFTPGVGHSTGPHLHFEVRTSTSPLDAIDPKDFFSKESTSTPMPAWGTTVDMTGIVQSMGVAGTQPAQNATPAPGSGTPGLTSPKEPSTPQNTGSTPATRGSQPKTPAKASGDNITLGQVATKAAGSAVVSLGATLQAPASSTTSKTAGAASETVFAQWNLVDSPILGKITFKITPSTVCLVLGFIALTSGIIMGQIQTGKSWLKDADKIMPEVKKYAKAAVATAA